MRGSGERKELSPMSAAILSTLIAFNRGIPNPSEQDFLHAADELENNPPPGLTPEEVSLLVAILRDEDID
jgi:hypothetical protein